MKLFSILTSLFVVIGAASVQAQSNNSTGAPNPGGTPGSTGSAASNPSDNPSTTSGSTGTSSGTSGSADTSAPVEKKDGGSLSSGQKESMPSTGNDAENKTR